MNHRSLLTAFTLVIFFTIIFWNLRNEASPVEQVREQYLNRLEDFFSEAGEFRDAVKLLDAEGHNLPQLKSDFADLRYSFKRIEFILDYLQPEDVKDYLNGAPLPKTERNVPRVIILSPKGLQVMEEILYSDEVVAEKQKLLDLCKELYNQTILIRNYQQSQRLFDRQIFEAVRFGLVRVMSMGVTGFDTPGSDNALQESRIAFSALYQAIRPYLSQAQNTELRQRTKLTFDQGEEWLAGQSDFDNFDHSHFIREYIEPLYGMVKDLQLDLHIETMEEVLVGESALNYQSDHIFSDDFLDPYFYTVLHKEMDSPELRELGRLLFFDPILSGNLKRSCASCHNPGLAFSDGLSKSTAFDEQGTVGRNAPGLVNAIYSEKFFYDLRADRMENQIEHVIFNEKEFHTNYNSIFGKLEQSEEYVARFNQVFAGSDAKGINRYTISAAIASYMATLRGYNTDLDRYLRGELSTIDQEVKHGFNLFMGKAGCATCHFAPTFSGLVPPFFEENETEVLGVLSEPGTMHVDEDPGRIASGRLADRAGFYARSFKTMTVRNTGLTGPYFHNGAYRDLREVVEFYNHGGAQGLGLELENQTLPGDSLGLNEAEINALVKFMESLVDTTGFTEVPQQLPSFSDPKLNSRMIGGEY